MERFITYARVSTQSQGKSGLGLEAQQRDLDMYLSQVPDHEVTQSFVEVESGKDDANRPMLQEALELARSTGQILLVSKLCRLSRDAAFVLTLMKDTSVRFRVATMPSADNFQLGIYALLNQQEREQISARTKAALAAAKARGVKLGNPQNLKRTNEKRRQLALQRAQQLASVVVPLRQAGQTLQQIADALNGMGLKTARGGHFHPYSRVLGASEGRLGVLQLFNFLQSFHPTNHHSNCGMRKVHKFLRSSLVNQVNKILQAFPMGLSSNTLECSFMTSSRSDAA